MYAKLFSRITESSIIEESITTRWVFVALLAISDSDGTVIGTDIAIARRINVPLVDFEVSMKVLMAPDEHSNSQEFEGRRVIPSVGERGYFLTGYAKYRNLKTEDERRSYMKEYMAQRRSCKHSVNNVNFQLAQLTHTEAEADTKAEAETIMSRNVLNYLNEKTGKKFQAVNGSLKFIEARIKEGATEDQCRAVIDLKCSDWLNKPDYKQYLRPKTLFNGENFSNYVGEIGADKPKTESINDSWDRAKIEHDQKLNEAKNSN